jgi:hypothetical protein
VNTAVTPAKTLQERVGERKKLVETAMHQAFFEPIVKRGEYGRQDVTDAYIVTLVRKLTQDRVSAAIEAWLGAHKGEIAEQIDNTIGKGMTRLVQDWIDSRSQYHLQNFGDQLKTALSLR